MTCVMGAAQTNLATEPSGHRAAFVGVVKRVSVLGATGSVGQSTLDVIGRNPHLFEVVVLTANGNAKALAEAARRHHARFAVLADASGYADLKECLAGSGIEIA